MGNYRPFLQGPLPVANYTRIIIPGRFWTRPPSTKSTRMASSATPLHDSLIELAIPDAHAHTIKWYLKKAYKERLVHERKRDHPQPVTAIMTRPRGRPPILLELDGKLLQYLKALRSKGGVINIHVVRAITKALIESNPSMSQLATFDMPHSWVQSIYRHIGFTRRMGTTTRPPVPQGLYSECRREYLRDVHDKVKEHGIPLEQVLNADQTPSSYVFVGRSTMAARGAKSVPIKGLTDKRNITLTFVVSFSGEFLPMQIIYGGKTTASQPRGFVSQKNFVSLKILNTGRMNKKP